MRVASRRRELTHGPPPVVLPKNNCGVGTVTKASSSKISAGQVISTSPAAGATAALGTKVSIKVSTGKSHKK